MSDDNTHPSPSPVAEDGHFRIIVSSDGLYVYLDALRAKQGSGKPVQTSDVLKALSRAKVSYGIDAARLDEIITGLNQGQLPQAPAVPENEPAHSPARLQHLCIAQGLLPQHGADSQIEWLLDRTQIEQENYVVVPGQVLANVTPASDGHEGKNVFGAAVRFHPGREIAPRPGVGIQIVEADASQQYRSDRYGRVQLADNQLTVVTPLSVSADRLEARMSLLPPSTPDTVLTAEHICTTLAKFDIGYGIQQDSIEVAVIKLAAQRQRIDDVVVACGIAAAHGNNAKTHWYMPRENNRPLPCYLKPGQPIVAIQLATTGADGFDIHKHVLRATPGAPIAPSAGRFVVAQQQEAGAVTFCSAVLGVLQLNDMQLSVEPGLTISADMLEARLALSTHSYDGKAVTVEDITTTLAACAVTVPVDESLLKNALAALPTTGPPSAIVVARGTPPQDGKDMRLILSHKESVGLELSHGRIDFNEHDYPWNVTQGETIGFILPAKAEHDGVSVTGMPIKAHKPHEIKLELTNVHQNERGKLIADVDGVLVIDGCNLSILDLLVINGDLNNTVGNVHSKAGVHVKGHVEPGLILESQKDVIIDKNVENATVKARGSITIKGGVRGHHSEAFTPGNLTVGFIENAAIYVNGDINVRTSIINSTVASNGAVFAGSTKVRHAAVMGGELTARHLIEAIELGTPTYARTVVRLGIPQELRRQLNHLGNEIQAQEKELEDLAKIEHHYRHHPTAQAGEVLQRVSVTRNALQEQLSVQRQSLAELRAQLAGDQQTRLVVHKKVYPGVIVNISDHAYEVRDEHGKGVFTLDDNRVVFHPG